MLTIAFWATMLIGAAHADDHCQARYDAAYQAYLNRQPQASAVLEDNRIVRDANSPVHGQREVTRTGREMAARAFAQQEYQRCQREG